VYLLYSDDTPVMSYVSDIPSIGAVALLDLWTGNLIRPLRPDKEVYVIDDSTIRYASAGEPARDAVTDAVVRPPHRDPRQARQDSGPDRISYTSQDSTVTAVGPDGTLLWSFDTATALPDVPEPDRRVASLTPAPSRLFVSTTTGSVILLTPAVGWALSE
jgi:hypothetical protein